MVIKSDKIKEPNTTISEKPIEYFTDVFSPWETKQQFRIGKEVKAASTGTRLL